MPPPLYPSIQGIGAKERGETNNLFDRYVNMNECNPEYGIVFNELEAAIQYIEGWSDKHAKGE